MNYPTGNKRISVASYPLYSGQKVAQRTTIINPTLQKNNVSKESFGNVKLLGTSSSTKHGKGSIIYQNVPFKIEGDLVMKNQSRDNSRTSLRSENNNIRSFTSNRALSSPAKALGSFNFKSNPSKVTNINSLSSNSTINKLKKDLPSNSNSLKEKAMTKKTKSYYIPKSARDKLNLSNISGISNINKIKVNEINNSYVNNDMMNRTKLSGSSKSGFNRNINNLKPRSSTPNPTRNSNVGKLTDVKLIKSNNDLYNLSQKKILISKSPKPNLSRSTKNTLSLKNSPMTTKRPFDASLIKQLNDFKNNKSPTPQIFKKLGATMLNNKNFNNTNTKFGAQNVKKIVTGSLVNMNMNNDNLVNYNIVVNDSSNGNNNINLSAGSASNLYISNNLKKEKDENQLKNTSNILKANPRTNSHKERESKGSIDFKEITTSPLLRKKPENTKQPNFEEEKDENLYNKNFNNQSENANKNNSFNLILNNFHNNSNLQILNPVNKVVKKNIKLIHELSKVGFSGYGVKKVNQDNYFVFKNFVGNPNHYYIDGHGVLGHEVSGFLRENLPTNLNNQLKLKNKNVLTHNINFIIEEVFLNLNSKLHSNEIIDTTFSGSTCVSCIYTPEKIITANVGDSRAVVGRCVNGEKWVSHNLSRDHKPNDKDERARIKKRGGRIQPFRDDDGEFVGPHRVWLKEDEIPGLAMSRSFGDKVASSVGVIAEPEIFEYNFQDEDKFFIIASDGVWEFIESDECVNIIKEFYLKNDIVGCCDYIHRESSTRWMKEEEVIDDISMIIVFLD